VITEERLRQIFSEGGAQEIYQEVKEMDELKRTLEAMEIDYYKPAVKGVRNKILHGKLK
jgi:hypothetical protein